MTKIWLIFKNELVKSNLFFSIIGLFQCDLNRLVPVYTYHKTEIDADLIEVDDDFWPSVNAVLHLETFTYF